MNRYNRIAHGLTHLAGSPRAFGAVVGFTAGWALFGVLSGAGRAWELVVTCGVPILTLLTVIVLQHAQNRETKAIDLKLNELLLALEEPNVDVIRSRHLADDEVDQLHQRHDEQTPSGSAGATPSPRPG